MVCVPLIRFQTILNEAALARTCLEGNGRATHVVDGYDTAQGVEVSIAESSGGILVMNGLHPIHRMHQTCVSLAEQLLLEAARTKHEIGS